MRALLLFLPRWIINAFGLWLAVGLFGTGNSAGTVAESYGIFFTAALILSVINVLLKPLITVISLPLIILTLGLFMLVVNGLMVYFAFQLTPGIDMAFGHAIITGVVIGIVNFVMNGLLGMSGVKE